MFWSNSQWQLAFFIQLILVLVVFLFKNKFQLSISMIFLAISVVTPVPLLLVSKGVSGAVFISDLFAIYLFFRRDIGYSKQLICKIAFFLLIAWPLISRILIDVYSLSIYGDINFDYKIFLIQIVRHILFYVFFSKLVFLAENNLIGFSTIFKIQSFILFGIFLSILINYTGLIDVDAWNSLIEHHQFDLLGKGGMFLYRGEIGSFGTVSLIIIYNLYINFSNNRLYYLILIIIILLTIIFSGSRQGLVLSFFSIILTTVFNKKYKKLFSLITTSCIFFYVISEITNFGLVLTWITKRFDLFLKINDVYSATIDRNYEKFKFASKVKQDFYYKIFGNGLGSQISTTESDYVNSFYYFGIIGIFLYVLFIWKSNIDTFRYTKIEFNKHGLLPFIVSLIMPLFGIQQWYLLTFGSNNSLVVYFVLFIFSIAYSNSEPDYLF